jgi:hypothetical protein
MNFNAQYITYCATLQYMQSYTQYVGKHFYLIITSDESITNFLISNYVLANNENATCLKCESSMN